MPEFRKINDPDALTEKKKKPVITSFQVWVKVTMRSRPKLRITFPHDERYDYETVLEIARELQKEYHWAAVSVVKVAKKDEQLYSTWVKDNEE